METTRAADLVEMEAAALAVLLEPAALRATVPGCPGWRLVDLARHTGGVHRWATAALAAPPGGDPGDEPAGPDDDGSVRSWFAEGAAALSTALRSTPATRPCWTFAAHEAPATAAFWARRQVLETALHRWDAQSAVAAAGLGPAPDPATWLAGDVAAEGVAEVADIMHPRQVRLGRTPAPSAALVLDDGDGRRTSLALPTEGAGAPGAVVTGAAPALLLLLWRRTDLAREVDAGRLRVAGDRAAAERLLATALTP